MNDAQALKELFRHMEWADSVVWAAAFARPEAMEDAGMRERLQHIHTVQRLFLQVWKGEFFWPQEFSFDDGPALLRWAREYYNQLTEYAGGIGGLDLSEPKPVPWARMFEARLGRQAEVTSLGETMLQAVLHSAYHRGQVNTRLRELGGEPPLTDFIVWVWSGRPGPSWPDDAT